MADNVAAVEDDLSLPRAAVNKMIKEMIPMIRVSNDARELVLNCCTEFIHLIASEANEICNKQTKKTISPEHVIQALESLGFHDYVKDVEGVYQQFKKQAQTRKKNNKMKNQGVSEEELLRQQQALIAKARAEQAQEEWMHMQQQQLSMVQQMAAGQQPMAAGQPMVAGQQPMVAGQPQMPGASLTLQPGQVNPMQLTSPKDAPASSPVTVNVGFPATNMPATVQPGPNSLPGNAVFSATNMPATVQPGPNSLLQGLTLTCNVDRPVGIENNGGIQENINNNALCHQIKEPEENNTHTSIEVIASSADMTETPMEVKEDMPSDLENT